MFTPPVSVSALPPAVWYTASCVIDSLWYACTAPSPIRPLVIMPSTSTTVCAPPWPRTAK